MACAVLAVGCTEAPEPVFQPDTEPGFAVTEYDAALAPSAAVLALVPAGASTLVLTDFDQLRLVMGFGDLDRETPAQERARFWRQLPRTAALSRGMLRDVDARLQRDFGFGQDDVAWEATYAGDAEGWVLAFHDDVAMAAVRRAADARVGPLAGAVVDPDRRLVTSTTPPDPEDAWGADPELVGLVGRDATAAYLERSCIPFDTVFGAGVEERLAAAPEAALRALEPLEAFSISFGGELATVRLGEERSDVFDRLRIATVLPPTEPEFGLVLGQGVADPSTGRIGYTIADPAAAARFTLDRQLPFAVCAD